MSQAGITNIAGGGGGGSPVMTLTGNTGGAVSPSANNINVVGTTLYTVTGSPGTHTLTVTPLPNAYPITPYVVGPVGAAGYQTIQSGINAANAAGGGIVYVQPGTYTENLTFFDKVQIAGTQAYENALDIIIIGVHTPPTSGNIAISDVELQSATHIFSSASAGSTNISIANCTFNLTSGFIFNLTNWTGAFNINDCGDISTTNGVMTNTAAATLFVNNSQVGAGTTQTLLANGAVRLDLTYLNCPANISAGTIFFNLALFSNTIELSGTANGTIYLADFFTGANAALNYATSGNVLMTESTVNSSHSPAIIGAGTGTLTYGDITFVSNSNFAGTLTLVPLPFTIQQGGTFTSSFTPYAPVAGGTTSTAALQSAASGMSNVGYVLTSTGTASLPTWQATGVTGIVTIDGDIGSVTGSAVTISGSTTGLTTSGSGTLMNLTGTLGIANGGTNATSYTQSNGVLVYNGTRFVNYAGPQINTAGQSTNTSQPCFNVYCSGNISSITGDGTAYTILFNTKAVDNDSNFNTSTGLFTAPVAGNYIFSWSVGIFNLTVAFTSYVLNLVADGGSQQINRFNPGVIVDPNGYLFMSGSMVQPMTVGATASLQLAVANSTKTIGIYGGANATTFSGALLN